MSRRVVITTCPDCGEIKAPIGAVTLHLAGDDSTYWFTCPDCDALVVKSANGKAIYLLTTGGADVVDDTVEAPALTLDDLIDLHFELEAWDAGVVA